MKNIIIILAILFCQQAYSQTDTIDVIVVLGQSNAGVANSHIDSLPDYLKTRRSDIMLWSGSEAVPYAYHAGFSSDGSRVEYSNNTAQFGYELPYAYEHLRTSNRRLLIVKHSVGETSLAQVTGLDWNVASTGELLDQFRAEYTAAQGFFNAQNYALKPLVVIQAQGEGDANFTDRANQYSSNLPAYIDAVNNHIGGNPKWMFTLLRTEASGGPVRPGEATVRSAIISEASARGYYTIDLSNYTSGDGTHVGENALRVALDMFLIINP